MSNYKITDVRRQERTHDNNKCVARVSICFNKTERDSDVVTKFRAFADVTLTALGRSFFTETIEAYEILVFLDDKWQRYHAHYKGYHIVKDDRKMICSLVRQLRSRKWNALHSNVSVANY